MADMGLIHWCGVLLLAAGLGWAVASVWPSLVGRWSAGGRPPDPEEDRARSLRRECFDRLYWLIEFCRDEQDGGSIELLCQLAERLSRLPETRDLSRVGPSS